MARFLTDTDYDALIKNEVRRLLDGRAPGDDGSQPTKLLAVENMAVKQIRNSLNDRYDCNAIFNATGTDRDSFIVMIVIDLTLYHLYSQTGMKDIPLHRKERYDDAVTWLRDAGRGEIGADLPGYTPEDCDSASLPDMRIISRPVDNEEW